MRRAPMCRVRKLDPVNAHEGRQDSISPCSLLLSRRHAPALAPGRGHEDRRRKAPRRDQLHASCHNIEATGESPLTDAPPFREIAKNYDEMELVDGFMEGLAVRHPLMPDWEVTRTAGRGARRLRDEPRHAARRTASDPATQGFDLLRANCARCHAIDQVSHSPSAKAPPFRDVVKKYDPDALRGGAGRRHRHRPRTTCRNSPSSPTR